MTPPHKDSRSQYSLPATVTGRLASRVDLVQFDPAVTDVGEHDATRGRAQVDRGEGPVHVRYSSQR